VCEGARPHRRRITPKANNTKAEQLRLNKREGACFTLGKVILFRQGDLVSFLAISSPQKALRNAPQNANQDEKGSLTLLFAGVVTLLGVVAFATLRLANVASDRSRAQAGADAVALAGATQTRDIAHRIARANDVVIISYTETPTVLPNDGREVVDVAVVVARNGTEARATARRAIRPWNPEPATDGTGEFWVPTTTKSTMAFVTTTTTR
jgi:Flp pilus assembly protein TadG